MRRVQLVWRRSILIVLLGLSSTMSLAAPDQLSKHSTSANKGAATGEIMRLTSLDWAPYTGAGLPEGGETTDLLRQVFAEIGYQLQVDFLPWTNAVNQVVSGVNGHLAYYPEYPLQDPKLLLSGAIGYSELGLVESVEKPLLLTNFLALANYRFGVVQDYLNMTELDRLIAANTLRPKINSTDKDNVLQVARGELDAAVIDKRVLQYLLKYDADVKAAAAGKVQFSQSLREHKSLHLVFLANPKNRKLIQKFNQQLQRHKTQFLPSAKATKSP
ncbi:transporter substrate-binding domain-containing protein [Rheinheimera riviphila]|uniref:Transporter substrate-binding domain-containing protein n=2 Tax=Rheinheimera riviphila TaxID=1834037 RepID=A0A437R4I0_9GAMM|nr:transporter substrate-binding domain-containing protein [Rheinheimera riviphila]